MQKIVVIDGSLLIDIENGDRVAAEIFERIGEQRRRPGMTPTACHELLLYSINDGIPPSSALNAWKELGVLFLDVADDAINNGFADEAAQAINRSGLLGDQPINLAHIIAEAAVAKCEYVIFDDEPTSQLDRPGIKKLLESRHLYAPQIISRTEFLRLR